MKVSASNSPRLRPRSAQVFEHANNEWWAARGKEFKREANWLLVAYLAYASSTSCTPGSISSRWGSVNFRQSLRSDGTILGISPYLPGKWFEIRTLPRNACNRKTNVRGRSRPISPHLALIVPEVQGMDIRRQLAKHDQKRRTWGSAVLMAYHFDRQRRVPFPSARK